MRVTSSREAYRNPWIRVREDVLEHDDGSTGLYGVVEKPDFAVVVARQDEGFWLVEQYRHPVGRRCWEFPQGTWSPGAEGAGTPEDLARAELAEETGLRAARFEHLGRLDAGPGLLDHRFDAWLATDLTRGETDREPTESDMRVALVPEAELRDMIRTGRLTDSASVAAFALLTLRET